MSNCMVSSQSNEINQLLSYHNNNELYERMNRLARREYNNVIPESLMSPTNNPQTICRKIKTNISASDWQLCKRQDYMWKGEDNNGNAIMVSCDGHGNDNLINLIKSITYKQWVHLFEDKNLNPVAALEIYFGTNNKNTIDSGVCIVMGKISNNKVEMWSAGDSRGVVYINDKLVLETRDHNIDYPGEINRLLKQTGCRRNKVFTNSTMLKMLKPQPPRNIPRATTCNTYMVNFEPDNKYGENGIQPTRCLGHGGMTSLIGENIEYQVIDIKPTDDVYMVLASDGLWDIQDADSTVLSLAKYGAYYVSLYAGLKWYNDWEYQREYDKNVVTIQKGISPDDINVVVAHKYSSNIDFINMENNVLRVSNAWKSANTNVCLLHSNKNKCELLNNSSFPSLEEFHRESSKIYCENDYCAEYVVSNERYCSECLIENEIYN